MKEVLGRVGKQAVCHWLVSQTVQTASLAPQASEPRLVTPRGLMMGCSGLSPPEPLSAAGLLFLVLARKSQMQAAVLCSSDPSV